MCIQNLIKYFNIKTMKRNVLKDEDYGHQFQHLRYYD